MPSLWKHILYPEHDAGKAVGGGSALAVKIARMVGYKMFAWNGKIYRVPDEEGAEPLSQPLELDLDDFE